MATATTKPFPSPSASTQDARAAGPMIDDGMQVLSTQLSSIGIVPQKLWELQLSMLSEILGFVARRTQAQAELCGRLGRCSDFSEAVEAQQDFANGVGGAYAEEVERLSSLTQRSLDAWKGVGAQLISGHAIEKKAA